MNKYKGLNVPTKKINININILQTGFCACADCVDVSCSDCIFSSHNLDQFESWFHTHFQEPKPRPRFVVKELRYIIAVFDTHHPEYKDDEYQFESCVAYWDNSALGYLPTWMHNKAHGLAKTLNEKE